MSCPPHDTRAAARGPLCKVWQQRLWDLVFVDADLRLRSWYKYEGLRIAKGQALLDWVADNPNLQVRMVVAGRKLSLKAVSFTPQAATLMAGVSRPSALPFTTRLHEGRLDRMAVWDPRDAAALRLLLSQFDLVGAFDFCSVG